MNCLHIFLRGQNLKRRLKNALTEFLFELKLKYLHFVLWNQSTVSYLDALKEG